MIKNIAYFPSQCALNSKPVMSAVLDCLQARGIQTQENSMTSDAAVIWSVLWAGRMAGNQAVYEHYRSQGKPVIVIEVGALYRGNTWKIAVNNITADGYYGHSNNLDWDRPRKLKISLATQFKSNPNIIVALQHDRSLQVAGVNLGTWLQNTINGLKDHTDRPITVRPHPRSSLSLNNLPPGVQVERPNKLKNTYDSYDMHFDCHAVVNYNSGTGIEAGIAGVRPIVESTSLAHPIAINYADIEKPYDIDRDIWLTQICHTEYTVDELHRGAWFGRIAPALEKINEPVVA
jgi:hypothetical protein